MSCLDACDTLNRMETPVLEGKCIRLEPLSLGHLPSLEEIAPDPTIWRYQTYWVRTPEELRAWVDRVLGEPNTFTWTTVQKAEGTKPERVVGVTRFLDLNLQHKTVEIGNTWLAEDSRGTRTNTEAKLLQLTHAFEVLGMNRVAFKTHIANRRSQAALKAIGAKQEGTFRNHLILPDGSLRDSVWFSIIRSEWPEVKELLTHRLSAPA